jgi:hypothetical protein
MNCGRWEKGKGPTVDKEEEYHKAKKMLDLRQNVVKYLIVRAIA